MSLETALRNVSAAIDYWLLSDRLAFIEGFLDPIEGFALLQLAEHCPAVGAIVEIGSFAGRSTAWLATGSRRSGRGKVNAVDHFQGSPEHHAGGEYESALVADGGLRALFGANMAKAGLKDWVRVLDQGSLEAARAWSHPIRLLFIDGDHSYEASRADYEAWSPWLAEGGVAAFHDIGIFPGVTRFYEELTGSGEVEELLAVGTLRAVRRAP